MSRALFDSLGEVHRYDDLEDLLDHVARVIVAYTAFETALVTFYMADSAFYGAAGCPADVKERFRTSFRSTPEEKRRGKREMILRFGRPGTNVCFLPAGEGPPAGVAYIPGRSVEGSWDPDDRLVVFMRSWDDDILGMVSLDNPRSGDRPDAEVFRQVEDVDRYVNVVAKIVENRFWSLRLRESEEAYRSVFNATSDALIVLDADGRIVETNTAACRLYGYEYAELVGSSVRDLLRSDFHATCDRFLSRIAEGFAFRVEARDVRKDGSEFDAEVHGTAFHYRGRLGLLTVTQDVTEKKRLFRRLLEQQKEESIVAIAGGVAHDFNNILMGIIGSVGLLRRHVPTVGEASRQCDRIAASADRLAHLTGQLLAIARGVHSEPRPLTMTRIVRDNLMLIRGMLGPRHQLDVELPETGWTVLADRVQMGQVLLNLAQNAVEALGRGGTLCIEAANEVRERGWTCERTGAHPPGDYVLLRVRDDGHGMPEATRRRLFDPYFSTKPTGSGLGLAAVLGIVKRHRGAIDIESAPGRGTTIEVLLPRADVPALPPLPASPPAPVGRLGRPRVLLVEDDPMVRAVAEEMLRSLGCSVVSVESGEEALRTFEHRTEPFELVLLDVTMPEMSGVEASEALFELDPAARIVLSSGHTEHLVQATLPHGGRIAGFLQKPYTLAQLEVTLAEALGFARTGGLGLG